MTEQLPQRRPATEIAADRFMQLWGSDAMDTPGAYDDMREDLRRVQAFAADGVFVRLDYEAVRAAIRQCEGQHVQQVSYSTYHDALTQVCFTEGVVRTSMPRP
jgi:hypothetical protein